MTDGKTTPDERLASKMAAKTEAKKQKRAKAQSALEKHPTQPVVTRVYDKRTIIDRRKKNLLEEPRLLQVLDLGHVPQQHKADGRFFDLEDPATGVSRVTAEDRGVFRYHPGSYGNSPRPCYIRSTVSATTFNAESAYDLLFGAKQEPLDTLGVPGPSLHDFVATRFRGTKTAVSTDFVRSAKLHDASEFGESDFEALWLRAFNTDDAASMLTHEEFDPEWWQPVRVDGQRRPLVRWCEGVRWTATDENALQAAQRAVHVERELEIKRRVRLAEAELRAEASE